MLLLSVVAAQGRVAIPDVQSPQQLLWKGDRIVIIDSIGEAVVLDEETLQVQARLDLSRWPGQAVLSEDGRRLLVLGQKTRVYDLDSGEVVHSQKSGRYSAPVLGLTADGNHLIEGTELLQTLPLDEEGGGTVIHPECCWTRVGTVDGQIWALGYGRLVVGDREFLVSENVWDVQELEGALALHAWGQTQILDVETGELSWEAPPGSASLIGSMSFSPDGAHIAWASSTGGVQTWDRRMSTPGTGFGVGMAGVAALAWSPDSSQLAIARWDGLLELQPMEGEPMLRGRPLTVGFVEDLAVAAFESGRVVIWREEEQGYELVRELMLPLDGGWESDRTVVLAPGALLVAATHLGTVETWDLNTGSPVQAPLPATRSDTDLAVGDDGSLAVRSGPWVLTFDADRRPIARMPMGPSRIAVGRGGTRLAVHGSAGLVVYDTMSGRSVATTLDADLGTDLVFDGDDLLFVHGASLMRWNLSDEPEVVYLEEGLSVSADISGGRLLTQDWAGALHHDEVTVDLPPLVGAIDIGLHPEKPLALRADETGRVELVDLVTGERTRLLGGPSGMGGVSALDGHWAVVEDGRISTDLGESLEASSRITAVVMTPQGPLAGTTEGTLVRWVLDFHGPAEDLPANRGEPVEVSVGEDAIVDLEWRADTLLVRDEYGVVSAWDGTTLAPQPVPYAFASDVALTPDGIPLYSLGWQGVYALEGAEWKALKMRRRHRKWMNGGLAVCYDGTVVATVDSWGKPELMLVGESRLRKSSGGLPGVLVVTCGTDVALGTMTGLVAVSDPHTGERKSIISGDGTAVSGLTWLDEDTLLVAWESGVVAEIDL